VELGYELSPVVAGAVEKMVHTAVDALQLAGFTCERRHSRFDA
jgi:hypothetical protein